MSIDGRPLIWRERLFWSALRGIGAVAGIGRTIDAWAARQLPAPKDAWVEWPDDRT